MNFDFLYHSYTLTVTIFAAVFGMAYPLMLQAIERIDDKYTSSVLATDLRKRWQFRTFNALIIVCIVCVAVLAYTIESTENQQWKYVEVSLATILIVALMVDVVLLVRQILTFYSPKELYEQLIGSLNKKNAEALYDIARFAEKADDFTLYISCMSAIRHLFLEEQIKNEDGKPVVYSAELYALLDRIAKKVADTSQTDDRYNNVGVIQILFNSDKINGISPEVYQKTWLMQNRAVKAGNAGWFRDYWTYAEQYFRFSQFKTDTKEAKDSLEEFYHYHVMTGALLIYFKRHEWLKHIMRYSQVQMGVPQYVLIPGTLSRIFEVMRYLDSLLDRPFGIYQKYQIIGLDRGVQMDEAIVGYAYRYLALLIIRIWSYQDYNYNHANPLDIPITNDELVEDNDGMIICVNQMKMAVDEWYKNGLLNEFGLHVIPEQKEVTDKLDEYILALKMKITEINARTDVDPDKAETIKNEIIVSNANSHIKIPMKDDETPVDLSNYQFYSTPITASEPIEREYLAKGSKKSLGNFGACLVTKLNFNFLNGYLKAVYQMIPPDAIYMINQKDLLVAIDKLALPKGYAIIEWGDAFGMYELRQQMTYHDNEICYKHLKVYSLGATGFSAEVLLIKEDEIPFIEIMDTAVNSEDYDVIDETNSLYSNIDHLEYPFEISIIQSIKVYALKNHSAAVSLRVQYNLGRDIYDLDKIKKIA